MDSSLNSKPEIQSATPPMEDNNNMEDSSHNDEAAISSALETAGNDFSQPPTISSKLLRMLEAATNRRSVLTKMQNNEEVFDENDGVVSEAPRTKRVSVTEAEEIQWILKNCLVLCIIMQ